MVKTHQSQIAFQDKLASQYPGSELHTSSLQGTLFGYPALTAIIHDSGFRGRITLSGHTGTNDRPAPRSVATDF